MLRTKQTTQRSALARAFGIGVVAGMRSMTAPATVSDALAGQRATARCGPLVNLLAWPWAARGLKVAAAGEMVADKLPFIPARTEPQSVVGRLGTGAISGAALSGALGHSQFLGGFLGALGALVGTYAFYLLRRELGRATHLPDAWIALAEDALALSSGIALTEG